ncbi:TonB-linked SusC/RagA family outer membrane protein [Flavobacterium arsenatis]|uniref:TonB-linked SusC/RagA family outer membrane protein n=1 Tax=Flavobacterium arsenatis TaxID=1484332 RepID=A0ABU1TLL6_9FLAO|nr:TonB-dependent receptor [Flavobacterium arsenatis]MDR6966864.1 TonB-linked SusC/RagA family outer membrane protein [Flavobacterium arsenatis]
MKFTKLLYFCFSSILFSINIYAQDINVRGKIVDEVGLPMPGVTVSEKGATNGTSTDFDGNYQITVGTNSILVYSFIGYITTEQAVNGRTTIDFKLTPDTESLEEVIVVGYGTQKKSVVTGAISSVKAKDLENLPITRVEQSLQGRASGVFIASNAGQPGTNSTIRVRGITSMGNNEPLWVVDGVIVDAGGIGFLNQADIESIEVLKDAASQAIYGSRSASGVILVTTKKGQSGKLMVSYNGFTGSSSPARKLDLLNAEQYATLRNEMAVNGGGEPVFANPSSLGSGTNWQDVIFNDNAFRQGHELSLSGGNDKSNFYVSFGLQDQDGIVMSQISKYTRRNIRLNSTHKVTSKLTFGQTLGYSNEKTIGLGNTNNEFGGPLASAINLDPLTPVIVTDPDMLNQSPYNIANIVRDQNGNPYGISSIVQQEMSNPLAYAQTRLGNYGWSDNFVGNTYVELEIIDGLKIRSTLGAKLSYWGNYSFTPEYYLNANSTNTRNSVYQETQKGFGWNIENTANYKKNFGKHNVDALIGQGSYVSNINRGNGITKFNIAANNWQEASINAEATAANTTAWGAEGTHHILTSLFARLNYDYDEKYLFTGIIRRDGSSRFGSNNKYGVFPSFSLGWVASNEDFWKENKVVNTLKFRGGYGITGSDAIPDWRFVSTIGGGRNYTLGTQGNVVAGFSPDAPSNPDLRWEETIQTNIGFDATLFNNFTLSFDIFNKQTNGILKAFPIPGYVGSNGDPSANVGDMSNTGFDVSFGYRKKMGDFDLSVNGNVSMIKNTVNYLAPGVEFEDGPNIQSNAFNSIVRTQPGQPVNSFFGLRTDGIFQNQAEIDAYVDANGNKIQPNAVPGDFRYKDLDGDGNIDGDDRDFIGNPLPDFTYGITINLKYKDFDLVAFGQGVAGNQIYQGLRRLDIPTANWQTNALNRWTGEGTSNSYPRLTSNDTNKNFSNASDFYLQDGDYFRIKIIQLGYSLPTKLIEKIGLQKVRLYVTGENLFTFTKYTGYDPEIGGGVMGIDRGYYPQAKTYMFGVNLQF